VLKVGITGGIGSGKTIICQVFKSLYVPVYNADQRAKILVEADSEIRSRIIKNFGEKSYTNSGYNRKYIADIVFNNDALLDKLNRIIHPAVEKDFYNWSQKYNVAYVIEEAAILFEIGANEKMDHVIVVDAPETLRISRIQRRNGLKEEEIKARVHNQWSTDKLRVLADWVIDNSDNVLVLPQILNIHHTLLEKSKLYHG
jgi:dephospho-CoA kinase